MATYKFSGNIAYHDDTMLWQQIVSKEKFINKLHQKRSVTDLGFAGKTVEPSILAHEEKTFKQVRPKTGQGYQNKISAFTPKK